MAELYRRPSSNFFSHGDVIEVGWGPNKSHSITLTYETPGWIAFDFATQIAYNELGPLTGASFDFFVDGIKRFSARGPYVYPRVYIYVDEGQHTFTWETNDEFSDGDWAGIREIYGTAFELVEEMAGIDQESPPQTLQKITQMETLNGFNRYQQGAPGGVEINFTLTFAPKRNKSAYENYADFFDAFPNFYILKYNYGMFGGVIVDPQVSNKGPLTFVDCLFHSPMKTAHDVEVW